MAHIDWVPSAVRSPVPPDAVIGGKDSDGSDIYVGLAQFEGDEIPTKVIPAKTVAYVAHNGKEHKVDNYRLLVERGPHKRLRWVPASDGHVPPHAVPGGRTRQGEPLFIGRAHHKNGVIVGKVHPSHRVCYISHSHVEVPCNQYEVLVSH